MFNLVEVSVKLIIVFCVESLHCKPPMRCLLFLICPQCRDLLRVLLLCRNTPDLTLERTAVQIRNWLGDLFANSHVFGPNPLKQYRLLRSVFINFKPSEKEETKAVDDVLKQQAVKLVSESRPYFGFFKVLSQSSLR